MLCSFDYEDHGYEVSDLTKVSSIFKKSILTLKTSKLKKKHFEIVTDIASQNWLVIQYMVRRFQ